MIKAILIGLGLCLCSLNVMAQSDSLSVSIDSSTIKVKQFNELLSEKYNGNAFDYNTLEGERQNILERILKWFYDFLKEAFGIELNPNTILYLSRIIYFLLILTALYLVIKLLGKPQA
ncbi:MAG: hypothetical protein JKY53_15155, partial [Flavobacteriales bacterium]|nr:hypothetical protein [Flavobacteriales bacterium]